jgi:hypothetical protein
MMGISTTMTMMEKRIRSYMRGYKLKRSPVLVCGEEEEGVQLTMSLGG